MALATLPDECLVRLFSFLPVASACALRAASRRLAAVGADRLLWHRLALRDGMLLPPTDAALAPPRPALRLHCRPRSDEPNEEEEEDMDVSVDSAAGSLGETDWHAVYRAQWEADRAWIRTPPPGMRVLEGACAMAAMTAVAVEAPSCATTTTTTTTPTTLTPTRPPRVFLGLAHGHVVALQTRRRAGDAAKQRESVVAYQHPGSVSQILVSDGTLFSVGFDGTLRTLELDDSSSELAASPPQQRKSPPPLVAWPSPAATSAASASASSPAAPSSPSLPRPSPAFRPPTVLVTSPSPLAAVGVSGDVVVVGSMHGGVETYERKTGRLVQRIAGAHSGWLPCLQLDGDRLVTGGQDGAVKVWAWEEGGGGGWRLRHVLRGHEGAVVAMQLCGDVLISGSYDHTVAVWNVAEGALVRRWVAQGHHVNALAFCARGQLVTGGEDGRLLLWNWRTGQAVRALYEANGSIECVALAEPYLLATTVGGVLLEFNVA